MAERAAVTIPPEGRLATVSFPGLLAALGLVRATGALDVSRQKLTRRFVLDAGRLQLLVSNAREDRLLEFLVARGALAAPAPVVEAAVTTLEGHALTGAALVSAGLLSPGEAREQVKGQLAYALRECAGWADATFAVRPGTVAIGQEPVAEWPAIEAAVELAREPPVHGRRPQFPAVLVSMLSGDGLDGVALDPVERDILAACGAPTEPADVAGRCPGRAAADVQAALATLWRAGLLVAAARPAAADGSTDVPLTHDALERWLAAATAEDLPALLGVGPADDPESVRRAYYRTVRRFHPDRFREGPFAPRHRDVERAFPLVHEALRVLTDPQERILWETGRHRPSATAARNPAQLATQLALRAYDAATAGRRSEAVALLEQAVANSGANPQHQLQLALLLLGNPARRRDAAERIERLAREHPERAEYLAAAALASSKTGRQEESAALARRALAADPQQAVARALSGDRGALSSLRSDPFYGPLF